MPRCPISFIFLWDQMLATARSSCGRRGRGWTRLGRVVAVSSVYETEPVEFTQQPWFLNCALALETSKTPQQLMAAILQIEEEMGRRRVQKKGPRVH